MAVMLLLAWFAGADLRRVSDLVLDAQFLHQFEEPLHRAGRFDAHEHRTFERTVKLAYLVALVLEDAFLQHAAVDIQNG
jgi:hypothetical protein